MQIYRKKTLIRELEGAMDKIISVNGTDYKIIKLLGKGKGGYSYLATDGADEFVLKQIHHEPCDYYQFGDKIQSEIHDCSYGGYRYISCY